MDKNKKRNYNGLISIIAIALILVLIVVLANSGRPGENILYRPYLREKIDNGEVAQIYLDASGTGYVRLVDSKITKENFPKNADYHFTFFGADLNDLYEQINTYNDAVLKGDAGDSDYASYKGKTKIEVVPHIQSASFIETIAPYVSIVVMLIIGFLLFRMFSSKGNGVGAFNKSRARLVERSDVKFDDVAGADEEKEEVKEIVEFLKNPNKFKALGARIPKGILLVGPPGTGKTLLAKAVAGESNVPFLSITGSDFVELYVGVGAGRVRDLFETAKKCAPCIVFIDEIDAVGRKRGAGLGGGNDEREQTLNQLLTEMDGFENNAGVIVLAATNRADVLDPALLRPGRFDRQIYVNTPDVRGREGILKIYAKNKPIAKNVDLKHIARLTSGFTGADLENCLNEAAIIAARENQAEITLENITEGINKVLMGPRKKSRLVTPNDKRLTAFHEAGHAIIAKLLDTGEDVHEVSIIPRGMAGGYTSTRPSDDDEHYTFKRLNNKICMMMGGRIAESLAFDDISAGASSDIAKATELARKMVAEWGMSEKLGFISFEGDKSEVFIGRDYQQTKLYSESTATMIDSEVKRILDYNYERGVKLLKENRHILNNFAAILEVRETLYQREVDKIMQGGDVNDVAIEIEKENVERLKREAMAKEQAELIRLLAEQKERENTAEALLEAGVINKEDVEQMKKATKEMTKTVAEKLEKFVPNEHNEFSKEEPIEGTNVDPNHEAKPSLEGLDSGKKVNDIIKYSKAKPKASATTKTKTTTNEKSKTTSEKSKKTTTNSKKSDKNDESK